MWNFGILGFNVDDQGFLLQMMDSIATNFQIDENRIYMCGISAGATMAYYMACRTDRLTAFGSVAGAMSKVNYQNCAPSHPIPLIDFRGTDDTVGPWNGDINTEGIETIISFWVNKNQCDTIPSISNLPDINTTDNATAIHYVYPNGMNEHTVEFYKIVGGGHTWPGGSVNILGQNFTLPNGNTCMDVDATREMWRFFSQYSNSSSTMSTSELTTDDFSVFPNPATDEVMAKMSNPELKTVEIIDLQGNILLRERINNGNQKINVSTFNNGMYILKMGSKIQKLIIER